MSGNGKMCLASRVLHFRLKRNLTQQDLADRMGVSVPRISEIEQGKVSNPRMDTLVKLARALRVSLNRLVG
jgi:transcriptional regulator with XRE-family HTH domain